jgi:mannose-6-phosphate isomerase-like protein (cupin superfamily)
MSYAPFDLQDSLVAYSADGAAESVSHSIDDLVKSSYDRVLGVHRFTDDESVHADYWERHPAGDELLYVLEGRLLVRVERDGAFDDVVIAQGQACVVPRASWRRLRVLEPGRLLFLTPPAGSSLRPHDAGPAGASPARQTKEGPAR